MHRQNGLPACHRSRGARALRACPPFPQAMLLPAAPCPPRAWPSAYPRGARRVQKGIETDSTPEARDKARKDTDGALRTLSPRKSPAATHPPLPARRHLCPPGLATPAPHHSKPRPRSGWQSLVTASMARGAGCSSRLALVEAIAVMTLAAPALQAPGLLSRPALPPALLPASSAGVTRRTLRLRGGATGLHDAVLAGSVFAIEGLIGAGADVDAPNDAGLSALHLAVEARRLGVAALLVAKGADVDACDAGERTPLHHAAARGHSGAVLVLLDLGADLAAADERGWTPLHEAAAAHQVIAQTVRCLLCGTQRA